MCCISATALAATACLGFLLLGCFASGFCHDTFAKLVFSVATRYILHQYFHPVYTQDKDTRYVVVYMVDVVLKGTKREWYLCGSIYGKYVADLCGSIYGRYFAKGTKRDPPRNAGAVSGPWIRPPSPRRIHSTFGRPKA